MPTQRELGAADGKVPVPSPSSPQFGDALGAKLTWMAERHIGHAEIRLSPDHLGAIDVRVHLNGDRIRAEFNSANADVRQAINDHLPRLRDMLSRHGFSLAESHVGNGSTQNHPQTAADDRIAAADDDLPVPAPTVSMYAHDGILDAFA
jgi:flagellar hook-length control protein FliK